MNKRHLLSLLVLVITLSLAVIGCGGSSTGPSSSDVTGTWLSSNGWTVTFHDNGQWDNSSGVSGTWTMNGNSLSYTVTSTGPGHTTGVTWTGTMQEDTIHVSGGFSPFTLTRV